MSHSSRHALGAVSKSSTRHGCGMLMRPLVPRCCEHRKCLTLYQFLTYSDQLHRSIRTPSHRPPRARPVRAKKTSEAPLTGDSSEKTSQSPKAAVAANGGEPAGVPDEDPPERGTPKPRDANTYGSATRRASRNKSQPRKKISIELEPEFLERNVYLQDDLVKEILKRRADSAQHEQECEISSGTKDSPVTAPQRKRAEALLSSLTTADLVTADGMRISHTVIQELLALFNISLGSSNGTSSMPRNAQINFKEDIHMWCPTPGTSDALLTLTMHLALSRKANLVHLTPEDICEMGNEIDPTSDSIYKTLCYDLGGRGSKTSPSEHNMPLDIRQGEEDEVEEEDDSHDPIQSSPKLGVVLSAGPMSNFLKSYISKSINNEGPRRPNRNIDREKAAEPADLDDPHKAWIDKLLQAGQEKSRLEESRCDSISDGMPLAEKQPNSEQSSSILGNARSTTFVVIEDYYLLRRSSGATFLNALHAGIRNRLATDHNVVIIGIDTPARYEANGKPRRASTSRLDDGERELLVPVSAEHKDVLEMAQKRTISKINLLHLHSMIKQYAKERDLQLDPKTATGLSMKSQHAFLTGLEVGIWPEGMVQRITETAVGILADRQDNQMSMTVIENAIEMIDASDTTKQAWLRTERLENITLEGNFHSKTSENVTQQAERLEKISKSCNKHEKKLLHGVVDAKDIHTTFADIRAPEETLEAAKTLISLSLIRPDAFKYGVLATDRIPGLLLYGPPGTGKTLLAKAIAKESGATMLEVSGSDIFDMYVGESEKNVRAIFTLARKLSPCVVFIDEGDAILGSRNSGTPRTSHRETLNQFLREWDGITTEMNAFIMIATNRPYDLDEASLRRLPRKLLIDLPQEQDREAILKIHLSAEQLHSDVSLSKLAADTPFYSGSDLKNLCVAAAMACIREEMETVRRARSEQGATQIDPAQSSYPERRLLTAAHFDKAMVEISASISEDMGSLAAIRKFDEKYGDRGGRRKRLPGGYGFKTASDSERTASDAARVRRNAA